MARILTAIEAVAKLIAAVSLALVALLTAGAVCLRAFGMHLPDALDLSSLFMAVAVFWGMISAVRSGSLIQVDFVTTVLPAPVCHLLRLFALVITAATFVLLARSGLGQILLTMNSGEVTPDLRLPLWPLLALGLSGLAVTAVVAIFMLAPRRSFQGAGQLQHTELTHGE